MWDETELDDDSLEQLYDWIDKIPLSRPKKKIERDFADGLLCAEVIKHFFPRLVELHNYPASNGLPQKAANWTLLNSKVLNKLSVNIPDAVIKDLAAGKPKVVEVLLFHLRQRIQEIIANNENPGNASRRSDKPESDQATMESSRRNSLGTRKPASQPMKGGVTMLPSLPPSQIPVVNHQPVKQQKLNPLGPMKRTMSVQRLNETHPGGDVVSKQLFDEKLRECTDKEDAIQLLQAKVQRLEHLVYLKDLRIEDLAQRLKELGTPLQARRTKQAHH